MTRRALLITLLLVVTWSVAAFRVATELRRADTRWRGHDFRTLAHDQSLFYRGYYPHAEAEAPPAGEAPGYSVYPPYAFVVAVPWLPPFSSEALVRWWFRAAQAAAIVALLVFGWRKGVDVDRRLGWVIVGATLGLTGLWADLLFGNFSALACAGLVALFAVRVRSAPLGAGLAWTAAMLKPQVGALFAAWLWRRQRAGLGWGVALILVAALGACAWTGVAPWVALSAPYVSGLLRLAPDGHSLVTLLAEWGVPGSLGQPILALAGLGLAFWQVRASDSGDAEGGLRQFAFVALIARLCLYHRPCDDVLLIFPLVYLARAAWRSERLLAWTAFAGLSLTLWLPTRVVEWGPTKSLVIFIWVGLAVLIGAQNAMNRLKPVSCG